MTWLMNIMIGLCSLWAMEAMAATASQHQGEQLFATYCGGCHTLRYAGHAHVSMPRDEAARWFGRSPPDLSNIGQIRGSTWLSAFLEGFYPDAKRPFGTNNVQYSDVAMPDVLSSIENDAQRRAAVHDMVMYLEDVADPHRDLRHKIGYGVIGFLLVLMVVVIALTKKCSLWR